MSDDRRGVAPFDHDVEVNEGYRYSANAGLSSHLANERLTEVTLRYGNLAGRSVIDVGCGDGAYTRELAGRAKPREIVGIDPAARAIALASERNPDIRFEVGDQHWLEETDLRFDIAIARGVLHHADDPGRVVRSMCRVANQVLLIEPNGLNPVLKVIERVSSYHREHGEKSYSPRLIDSWLQSGGMTIDTRLWAGLVPFFCPAPAARILKAVEPVVERLPVLSRAALAVYVVRASRPS